MTVDEMRQRFPEIPAALRDEPLLAELAAACDDLLRAARQPSPCSRQHDAANHYYLKLVGPLAIHGYGLSSREKVRAQMQELVDRQRRDPAAFAASLLPPDVAAGEVRGPTCQPD